MNRIISVQQIMNKNKKWYEFWKPEFIEEYHYLKIENDYIVLGEKK